MDKTSVGTGATISSTVGYSTENFHSIVDNVEYSTAARYGKTGFEIVHSMLGLPLGQTKSKRTNDGRDPECAVPTVVAVYLGSLLGVISERGDVSLSGGPIGGKPGFSLPQL